MAMDARKPTVLLVDDSPDIRESVGDYLRSQGLNVLLAAMRRVRELPCRPASLIWFCSTS